MSDADAHARECNERACAPCPCLCPCPPSPSPSPSPVPILPTYHLPMGDERMDRRGFWRAILRGAARRAVEPVPSPASRIPQAVLRPPGALEESAFLTACLPRCRHCVDTCPVYALVPSYDVDQPGGGDGRPYLLPDRQACVLCGLCMLACPTGALEPTPPEAVRIGRAVVRYNDCVRLDDQACHICHERCPVEPNAVADDEPVPSILGERCTGCGLCAEACPPHAISVVPRP